MHASDTELIHQFVRNGSEGAFTELLRRHVDLVYSAALRQVGPDVQAAEDLTQTVFTGLARKAEKLQGHSSLTGWLYTSTRLAATQHRRTEVRRLARETAAHAMSQLLSSDAPEPDWNQLRPVLDEAMHDLNEADREAVLLRFFEKRPYAEIGTRLGLSENTARMRVERALDQLHAALAKRGVTSTAAALGLALGAHAVAAAPAGIVERIGAAALTGSGATVGGALSGNLVLTVLALLLGIGALMWTSRTGWNGAQKPISDRGSVVAEAPGGTGATNNGSGDLAGASLTPTAATTDSVSSSPNPAVGPEELALKLTFVAKDSGRPVPNVTVNYRGWEGSHFTKRGFASTRFGEATVRVAPGTTLLELTSVVDGFADTQLRWVPERGDRIPTNYTVRLERAVPIGGKVVDPEGRPVAGAKVGWNHQEDGSRRTGVESHEFGWIEVGTDADGRWRIDRIAEAMLAQIYGSAAHPDYQPSDHFDLAAPPEAGRKLRDRTHVFQLKQAAVLQGVVLNEAGEPIAGAEVLAGQRRFTGSREVKTLADGTFEIRGVTLGPTPVTAQADGYAAKTIQLNLAQTNDSVRLVLGRGTPLRLRLVNQAGKPVPKAYVWLNTMERGPRLVGTEAPLLLQAGFEGRSDEQGRVVWNEAPAGEHHFDIKARGYMRTNHVAIPADGQEHVLTLAPALVIQGRVTDSATGQPVPKFRVVLGWPSFDPISQRTTAQFSSIERFWLDFTGGAYRHSLEEMVSEGTDPRCVLKFEAEGYLPQLSRPLRYDEGVVTLDMALEPASELEVTVADPVGRPVAGADVGLVLPGAGLKLSGGHLTIDPNERTGALKRADGKGKLRLMNDPQVTRIVVAHPTGYLETGFAALTADPVIRLQPWGRIEGEFLGAAGLLAGKVVSVSPWEPTHRELDFGISTTTDDQGRFTLSQVPPGKLRVSQLIITDHGNGVTSSQQGSSAETTVLPGEVSRVTLGGGYRVTGSLRLPTGFTLPQGSHWIAHVQTPMPQLPPELRNDQAAMQQWLRAPEIQALMKQAKHRPVTILPDGAFTVEAVQAGDYRLQAMLRTPSAMVMLSFNEESARFSVPAEPAFGEINLGEIPAQIPSPAP